MHIAGVFRSCILLIEEDFAMTEADLQRGLKLIRYGGVVITVTVFIVLLAFSLVVGNALGVSGGMLNSMLPYIIGFTVLSIVLSVVVYFGYRAVQTNRLKTSTSGT
jgi:hypothetical protein